MKSYKVWLDKWELDVIVECHQEWRMNTRFALTRKGGIVRYPIMSAKREAEYLHEFRMWMLKVLEDKPQLADRYRKKVYQDGGQLQVLGEVLNVHLTDKRSIRVDLQSKALYLPSKMVQSEEVATQLSKALAKACKSLVTQRVHHWNTRHFNQQINKVTLRYAKTRWGSCSTKRNISLSTRLLIAPLAVLDYVIVHELAHLLEMNHSKKYWSIVERVMPEYKTYEQWLKEYGPTCDF